MMAVWKIKGVIEAGRRDGDRGSRKRWRKSWMKVEKMEEIGRREKDDEDKEKHKMRKWER